MRPQSLLKQVHRREKEYHDAILASLAHELGVTNVFPAPVQRDGINQVDNVRNTLQANHTSGVCLNLTCGTSSEPRPIQEVDTNNTKDTGDAVDLSTTPRIQRRGETAPLPPHSGAEYVDRTNKLSCTASGRPLGQHVNDNSETSGMTEAIPETRSASLVCKPRLRQAQETNHGPGTVNLQIDQVGLSPEHMPLVPPRRPQKARPSERQCSRRDRKVVQKRIVEAAPEKPKFRHASPPRQTRQRSSYGKAWYMNPDLWGMDGSRKTANSIVQESDGTEETKEQEKLLARMEAIKGGAIPTLFSAVRFVKYIRQQGFRMPAHLESTDRAMEMETNVRARRSGNTKKMAMT